MSDHTPMPETQPGEPTLTPQEQTKVVNAINTFTDWHGWEIVRRVRDGQDVDYFTRHLNDTNPRNYAYFADVGAAYFYVLKMIGGAGKKRAADGQEDSDA